MLQTSELFCQIGDPKEMEAVLAINESNRNFVAQSQAVEIIINHLPDLTFESTIEQIATTEMTEPPRRLTERAGGELLTQTDTTGREQLMSTTYQARVLLNDPEHLLRVEYSETSGCKSVDFIYSILGPDNTPTFKLKYKNKIFPV